jgi:hypothetical protein
VRQGGTVGVGEPSRRVEEAGHEQGGGGVPANQRATPGRQRPEPVGVGDVRCQPNRGDGRG